MLSGSLTLAVLVSSTAAADGPRVVCDAPKVVVEGALSERWAPAVERVCQSLRALADLDPAAEATVVSAPSKVKVSVVLADGRTAERRVATPSRLLPTLEALLVVPRLPSTAEVGVGVEEVPTPVEEPVEPVRHPLRRIALTEAPEMLTAEPSPLTPADPTDARYEIGADVGARIGRDVALGPQLFANVHLAAWRIGAAIRWDAGALDRPAPENGFDRRAPLVTQMQSIVGEIQVGRHLELWRLGLDLGVSPRLGVVLPLGAVDFRGGAYARIGYRVGSLNLFAALDAEVSRTTLTTVAAKDSAIGLTGGLALGAAWFGL